MKEGRKKERKKERKKKKKKNPQRKKGPRHVESVVHNHRYEVSHGARQLFICLFPFTHHELGVAKQLGVCFVLLLFLFSFKTFTALESLAEVRRLFWLYGDRGYGLRD